MNNTVYLGCSAV